MTQGASKTETAGVPVPSGNERLVAMLAVFGALALLGAALMLWAREGLSVFADVILAGLAACF